MFAFQSSLDLIFILFIAENIPWYKKAIFWICGIEGLARKKSNSAQKESDIPEMKMDIDEDPCQSSLVNILAMMLMVGTAFVWGYYA